MDLWTDLLLSDGISYFDADLCKVLLSGESYVSSSLHTTVHQFRVSLYQISPTVYHFF